jgi:DNA-binding LytR/AlgR family response regulator
MTALIVDDEELGRALLRQMLEAEGVEIVGEAGDATEGLEKAELLDPDVVFVDIRMPGISGLQATSAFNELDPAPLVVIVTGYSEYAVDAFGKSALDYLLKPVDPERLAVALDKARKQIALQTKAAKVDVLRRTDRQRPVLRLPIRVKGAIRLLPVERILYASAQDKTVVVKTKDAEFRTTYTLTQLEGMLPSGFMRVHASCIVNIAVIEEIQLLGNHTYGIRLVNGDELPLGRQQYPKLQEKLFFRPIL